MAALQYVDVPGYAAIIFRRSYADLALPGAIMDRAGDWLGGSAARWNGREKTWTFPSGATLSFGYLDTEHDKYRYQGAEMQFIAFDELTQFRESQYRYLFSRLRRLEGSSVPLRMRAGSNPGGIGHEWVRARFIDADASEDRVFVPALLADNPYLDQAEYEHSLMELDPVTRAQLLRGDWTVLPEGTRFKRQWFDIVEQSPTQALRLRYWDKAGTEDGGDYSAGVLLAWGYDGGLFVEDVVRGQWSALVRERIMRQTAELDRQRGRVVVWLEQEPGSGGKESAEASIRNLAGEEVYAATVTGDKLTRSGPFAAQCEAGNVKLIRGEWNAVYLDELCSFPLGGHDDMVDGSSGAFNKLTLAPLPDELVYYDDPVTIGPQI